MASGACVTHVHVSCRNKENSHMISAESGLVQVCTDKVVDAPVFSKDENTLEDTLVKVEKADCSEDMDCESSRSPLIYKV
jgi:hypothetical protein